MEFLDYLAANIWVSVVIYTVIILTMIFVFVRKYVMIFPPYEFYVHLRRGKVYKQGEGGMVIKIPFFDKVLVVDRTVQQLNIDQESILSKEKQRVKVNCVLQWQAEDAGATINNVTWKEIPTRLRAIIESVTRTACAQLSVIEILEERQIIIDAIKKELVDIIAEWGLKVNTVEIIDVQVENETFVRDLARPREAEIARNALLSETEKDRTTQNAEIERNRTVRLAEVEKDQAIGVNEQEQLRRIQEAERSREQSVLEIEMQKDLMQKKYQKQQAEVDAARDLEVAKFNAEAVKQRKVKQEVEVLAQKILQEAKANADKVRMAAEAKANEITLEGMAEADITKAKLTAEANGLLKRAEALEKEREAQQKYSPQEFARDFVRIIPEIFENIEIGDITTFAGMGGDGSDGEGGGTTTPLEFFGNTLLPMFMISQMMGFDFRKVLGEGMGEYALPEMSTAEKKAKPKKGKA